MDYISSLHELIDTLIKLVVSSLEKTKYTSETYGFRKKHNDILETFVRTFTTYCKTN